ncbi:MAG: sugar ABC transporter permease, partial [Chloroflexia bacterium]
MAKSKQLATGAVVQESAKAEATAVVGARTQRDLWWALLYMSPAILLFVAFTFLPFLKTVWLSLNVTNQVGDPSHFNGVDYYWRVLNLDGKGRDEYLKSIGTTIYFTILVVPIGIVIAVGLAVMAAAKLRGIQFFRTIYTSTVAISVASASVIWALIYNPSLHMTNWVLELFHLKTAGVLLDPATALPAVAFMTIWVNVGFNFIIVLGGIQAIPQDYYDSSKIDGAGAWATFRSITLPLLTPSLLFLLIISTISAFQ